MNTLQILRYNIHLSISQLDLNRKLIINTINPHSYCVSKKDDLFRQALQQSDVLIPDGIGIVWAARFLHNKKIQRIAGADLHEHLLHKINQSGGKAFYLGAMDSTLHKIAERLKNEYPNIVFACYSPPYRTDFSEDDNKIMIEKINAFQPNVLFVGMTAPKQEKWAYTHKDDLKTNIIASIGAVFDFYAGTVQRPRRFWIELGLEWLPRLIREPKRLWRRNFISTPTFLWDVFKAKIGWLRPRQDF